eukprot:6415108-Prorocentrum_lima.AAC.1
MLAPTPVPWKGQHGDNCFAGSATVHGGEKPPALFQNRRSILTVLTLSWSQICANTPEIHPPP